MSEPKHIHININFDFILEILRKGVRRADIFMGIGLNAAAHEPSISHVLATEGFHHINLVKDKLTPQEQEHVSLEFGKWIRANGLRELIETFQLFCDQLYLALIQMQLLKPDQGTQTVPIAQFEQRGLSDKLDTLAALIEVNDGDRRVLRTLNQARNCYAHRQGRIGQRDLAGDTASMILKWNAFQLEAEEPDGNIVPQDQLVGHFFEHGAMMQIRVVERTREFALGTELVLDKQDLKEICLSTLTIGERLTHKAIELARDLGILNQAANESMDKPESL